MTSDTTEEKVVRLTDFRMAGFLSSRGVALRKTEMNGSNEVVFVFNDEGGEATKGLFAFPNSDEQRFDSACKAMLELVKIHQRNNRKGNK